jgi:outer membrane protein assembly factor BamB
MDALVAIRSGGKGDVSESHIKWTTNEGVGQVPSPLVYRGRVYLVKHGGIVTCFNAETGDKIYSDKLGPRVYYNASPVAADGKIYFCSYLGSVVVVQAGDTFKMLAHNRIGERINATPALVEGTIYLRTAGHLMAFRD